MKRQSSISLRPTRFSQLVGQGPAVSVIKKTYEKQEPSAWMFYGPTGTGKTTAARILAVSLQCEHGEFGEPCDACYAEKDQFAIEEVNASEVTGVDEISAKAEASMYAPPYGRRRVFILDEAQRMSKASQNLLLKYFEDAPPSTVWMICTTEQHKILGTLQRRCSHVELKKLSIKDITILVKKVAASIPQETPRPLKPLLEALFNAKVQLPGFIVNAVDAYLVAGKEAKDAIRGLGSDEADTLALCISVTKGDWDVVKNEIKEATPEDLRGIRAGLAGYLGKQLKKTFQSPRGDEMVRALTKICWVDSQTDITQPSATIAMLYEVCQIFGGQRDLGMTDE